jgi:putative phosphoesterase
MRIALLADIHGNSIALDAVLADVAAAGGVDGYWVLGDLVAIGHDPVGVMERLVALPAARFVRGNTDRYLLTGERPPPSAEDVRRDLSLVERYADVAANFAWTQGALAATGWLGWLSGLTLEMRFTLPDGRRFLGVHAAPGSDEEPDSRPTQSDEEMAAILAGCGADLVCVGHTHWPLDRHIGAIHLVNPGSVSTPMTSDRRASYALLDARPDGYQIELRRVEFDRQAVIEAVARLGHPGGHFITRLMRGEVRPGWLPPGGL